MNISKELIDSSEALLNWGCGKLTHGEGFSIVMLTHHPDGKRAQKYSFDTVEEAIEQTKQDIQKEGNNLTGYVFCYDATINFKTGPQRGFIFEAETLASECRFILFHGTHTTFDGTWIPDGYIRLLETDKKLIRAQPSA